MSFSGLPPQLLLKIVNNVVLFKKPVYIHYSRPWGQSPYRDIRSLALVDRKISFWATKQFYSNHHFDFSETWRDPADLAIFLAGLRESTADYLKHIEFTLGCPWKEDVETWHLAFEVLWFSRLASITVSAIGEPGISTYETLLEFDKVERFELDEEALESAPELLRWLRGAKEVIEGRKPRTRGQKWKLNERRWRTRQAAVDQILSTWHVAKSADCSRPLTWSSR